MTLVYGAADELPVWVASIDVNGTAPDFTAGWTFTCTLSRADEEDVVKTTGFTGSAGQVTVEWAVDELDLTPGTWRAVLVAKRTSDNREFSVRERLYIRPR